MSKRHHQEAQSIMESLDSPSMLVNLNEQQRRQIAIIMVERIISSHHPTSGERYFYQAVLKILRNNEAQN